MVEGMTGFQLFIVAVVMLFHAVHSLKDLSSVTILFTTCGSVGRSGPSYEECIEYYSENSPNMLPYLERSETRGVQLFTVPRTGIYDVFIAGASGGRGVCSTTYGLGYAFTKRYLLPQGVPFEVIVGQRGLSGCRGSATFEYCSSPLNTTALIDECVAAYQNLSTVDLDGGGGGGGASLFRLYSSNPERFYPIAVAGGGGGGASFENNSFSSYFKSNNYSIDASKPSDMNVSFSGGVVGSIAPGVGAGYFDDVGSRTTSSGDALSLTFPVRPNGPEGGTDVCHIVHFDSFLPSQGGYGGGGAGCGGGGGGGGYNGGRVVINIGITLLQDALQAPGEGGTAFVYPVGSYFTELSLNDGDGYVLLFPSDCACTGGCISYENGTFECTCPNNTYLAPDEFDCFQLITISSLDVESQFIVGSYRIESYILSEVMTQEGNGSRTNSSMSNRSIEILEVYSVEAEVVIVPEEGSGVCVLALVGSNNTIYGVQLIQRNSQSSITVTKLYNLMVMEFGEAAISNTSLKTFDDPLRIGYLVLFEESATCRLNSVIVNASIRERESVLLEAPLFDLSTVDYIYEVLLPVDEGSTSSISAGEVAAIVISLLLLVIAVLFVIAGSIWFLKRRRMKRGNANISSLGANDYTSFEMSNRQMAFTPNPAYTEIQPDSPKDLSDNSLPQLIIPNYERLGSLFQPEFGVSVPEDVNFALFNQQRTEVALKEWEYPRENLIYMRELGEGQFGKVHLMKAKNICGYKGTVPVAVKILSSLKEEDRHKFYEEINLMRKLPHPNIVSLLGMCSAEEDGAPMLILELMEYGDLRSFLIKNSSNNDQAEKLNFDYFNKFASDISSAMAFLSSKQYVHRDIAARNCLVGSGLKVKLADFGLTRAVHDKDYYRIAKETMLPIRWMAPESVLYGVFTLESDVWAFGVLLWEIASFGERPLPNLSGVDIVDIFQRKGSEVLLERPKDCPLEYYKRMQECQSYDPASRPNFKTLHQHFSSVANIRLYADS